MGVPNLFSQPISPTASVLWNAASPRRHQLYSSADQRLGNCPLTSCEPPAEIDLNPDSLTLPLY